MSWEIAWALFAVSLLSTVPAWLAYISNQQHEARESQKRQIVRQTLHAESEVFRLTNQALDELDDLEAREQSP